MRVATLNLFAHGGDWPARRAVLAAGFQDLDADLVALQETIVTDDEDQVVEVLGDDYHVVHQTDREPDGQGVSIASRWPVREVHEIDLNVTHRTRDFACTTLVALIDVPAPVGALLFVNHLPNWQVHLAYERELQAVATARFLEVAVLENNPHVVVAGDLDADPASASIRFWTGRQSLGGMSVCYRDAWESAHPAEPGHTFVPDNPLVTDRDWPFRRIDYLLVRCGEHGGPTLAIRSCELLFDRPGGAAGDTWASDHFGVTADLYP